MERKVIRKVLQIDSMTCTGCELRIENALKGLDGILDAKAMYSSSNVYVTYDATVILLDRIISEIEMLGYKVKNKNNTESLAAAKQVKCKEDMAGKEKADGKMSVSQLLGVGIIILALYVIIKNTVGFNFIPQVNRNMGYGFLFIIGLITSLHCVAMCGGINLSQCVSYRADGGEAGGLLPKIRPSLLYNAGRVISYTIIGGIAGALGSAVSFTGAAKGVVAILSGAFMVIMGLNMLNLFPWLRRLNPRMPRFFGNKINSSRGNHGPFYVGLLNGLMPCGPLQAIQIYALGTGSFAAGALSMFLFSLGTVPLMFGFGAASSFLSSKFTHRMLKFSAVLVMVLGLIMVNRGLNLSGVSVYASSPAGNVAKIEGNVQTVTTSMKSGNYSPIIVQKGVPVKWTIKADSSDLNGCNNPMTIPKYHIQKELAPGDNLIEFTPEEEGTITYTCWMGMVSSTIRVVPDINSVSAADIQAADSPSAAAGGGGCCGPR